MCMTVFTVTTNDVNCRFRMMHSLSGRQLPTRWNVNRRLPPTSTGLRELKCCWRIIYKQRHVVALAGGWPLTGVGQTSVALNGQWIMSMRRLAESTVDHIGWPAPHARSRWLQAVAAHSSSHIFISIADSAQRLQLWSSAGASKGIPGDAKCVTEFRGGGGGQK